MTDISSAKLNLIVDRENIVLKNNIMQATIAANTLSVTEENEFNLQLKSSVECNSVFESDEIKKIIDNSTYDNFFQVIAEWDMPIIIQAKWHKKYRTRKKWLKRFGVIKDTVHCTANSQSLERTLSEDFGSYSTEVCFPKWECHFKPYQKQKGMIVFNT